jgi:hypothetical protein
LQRFGSSWYAAWFVYRSFVVVDVKTYTSFGAAPGGTGTRVEVHRRRQRPSSSRLTAAALIVISVFLADVLVLYGLSKIGGVGATFTASIKKLGGSIFITAAGLLGGFLAIAVVGIAAVYFLSKE